jgi:molybdopterin-containing oxidoreductase family membrane subunit
MVGFDSFKKANKKDVIVAVSLIALSILIGLGSDFIFRFTEFLGFKDETSVIPGWHTIIFPIEFPLGQILTVSCLMQVLITFIFIFFQNTRIINLKVIEYVNIGLLILGILASANYLVELFVGIYTGYIYEQFTFYSRVFGSYWRAWYFSMLLELILPQLLWFTKIRKSTFATLIICIIYLMTGFIFKILLNNN